MGQSESVFDCRYEYANNLWMHIVFYCKLAFRKMQINVCPKDQGYNCKLPEPESP